MPNENDMPRVRLITRETRPDLYARLADSWQAANDNRAAFQRAYRRHHPVLAFLAWCGESNWRVAALIASAILIGSLLERILP